MKFDEHQDVLELLNEAQEVDTDNRERARTNLEFITLEEGQWETGFVTNSDKPRYTFDMTSPVVDQIAGEMDQSEFGISVSPASSDADKDTAQTFEGLIRNIENISDADMIYSVAGREAVAAGFSGWMVKTKYVDDDSFEQDLVIDFIANPIDSIWPGPFKKPDASDMTYCFVLEAMPKKEYEKKYPDRNCQGLSENRWSNVVFYKEDQVIIGQIYYLKKEKRELLLLSDGKVVENDEEWQKVADEYAEAGITVTDSRDKPRTVCFTRMFDAEGWINEPQRTVFNAIPIQTVQANYSVIENKPIYFGAVDKLKDPQRVYNWAKSREIEEGALAPRAKYWLTPKQAGGHEAKLGSMNTNSDPFQLFNPDPENPGAPQQNGGAQINPGLANTAASMQEMMRETSGFHAANMGDNPALQSGVAIERLQDRGDIGSIKFFKAMEWAIARTGKILVDAIPKVYDTERQVRILKDDGSYDMVVLNQPVIDNETGEPVTINDLSKGKYDVTCKAGPAFDSRQQKTIAALTEMAQFDPSVMEIAGDVAFKNVNAPGMDQIAERKRQMLFNQGLIPFEQMTDEEKMRYQQMMQQPQPPDPAMLLAQAEQEKAMADREANQVKMAVEQEKVRLEAVKLQLEQGKQELAMMEAQIKAQSEAVNNEAQMIENQIVQQRFGLETRESVADTNKTVAETGKIIKETALMGVGNA